MAPVCSNCGGTEFVWANELKTGSLGGGSLSLRSRGELSLGTRICRACGHADLFLKDPAILRMPHTWRPGEFTPIVPRGPAPSAHHPSSPAPAPSHIPAAPPSPVVAPPPEVAPAPPPAAPAPVTPTPAVVAPEAPVATAVSSESETATAPPEPTKKPTRRRSSKAKSGGN